MTDLSRMTVADMRALLHQGIMSSRELVEMHLAQIARFDPAFHAVRCLSPSAVDDAVASDEHRASAGPRSELEGIPVLIKDNIDVAGLPTTAGALALETNMPAVDAPIVATLRAAGAIILGKTNLSEMANFLTEGMPSGYSSLGGQVLNPYDTSLTPSGSSSGSATAVVLGFAPLTLGTETDGSITSPADHQSMVGMKPTHGLLPQAGIVPIAASQDTAGPMTRTVGDAAVLLGVLAPSIGRVALDASLSGVGFAVVREGPGGTEGSSSEAQLACFDAAILVLAGAGAALTDVTMPLSTHDDELTVLHYEYAPGIADYLATVGPGAPLHSLAELQAWNQAHAGEALKFRQIHVDTAVAVDHAASLESYQQARARDLAFATSALQTALGDDRECVVFIGASGCSLAARAGWPSIVIPAGYTSDNRRPVGVMLVSRPGTDAQLLSLALAFERALPARRTPMEVNPAVFRGL
jgi:amidase